VELAEKAGLQLDDWQSWSVEQAMGTREDGRWAAFEVGLLVSRQNGKNAILQARQLAGLFLIGESLIIHTAHEFKAANEHFRRMRDLVESQSWLMSRVRSHGIRTSHGDEAIELRPTPTLIFGSRGVQVRKSVAPRLRFLARSRGSGRSFTCECLCYDESMILSDEEVGASLPTLSAVANPQVWYTASAGYQDSTQLNRVRNRGIRGTDDSLVWLEWSIDEHHDMCKPGCTEHDNPDSVAAWARANPGLGIRISTEHVHREYTKMSPAEFKRERLGVGEWPADEMGWAVIPEPVWDSCAVELAGAPRPSRVAIAADVTPDQSASAIVIAGLVPGGKILIERGVATMPDGEQREDHRAGTSWVVPRLKELASRHRIAAIVIDPLSPAAQLLVEAEKAGLDITTPTTRDVGQAFGQFYTLCADQQLIHGGQADMRSAVAGAQRREIGDGQYAWARKATAVDISPLCAATLAAWAANKFGRGYNVLNSVR
jgi:phage terminase large subunit-like protein